MAFFLLLCWDALVTQQPQRYSVSDLGGSLDL
jgi:hypothetical protein